jgi:hypothetical protein
MFEGLAGPMEDRKTRLIYEKARDERIAGMEESRWKRLTETGKFFGMVYTIEEIVKELQQIEDGTLDRASRRFSDPNKATERNQLYAKEADEAVQRTTGGNIGLKDVEHAVRDGGNEHGLEATSMVDMAKDIRGRLVLENPAWRGNAADFDE